MNFWKRLFGGLAKSTAETQPATTATQVTFEGEVRKQHLAMPNIQKITANDLEELKNWDGFDWAEKNGIQSASEAWAKLQRPDWMLKLVDEKGVKLDESQLRLFTCDCAEKVLPIFEKRYPKDKRPREAIQRARAFAKSDAPIKAVDDGHGGNLANWMARRAISEAANAIAYDAAFPATADTADVALASTWKRGATGYPPYDTAEAPAKVTSVAAAASWEGWKAAKDATGETNAENTFRAAEATHGETARVWQADRLRFYFPNPFKAKP